MKKLNLQRTLMVSQVSSLYGVYLVFSSLRFSNGRVLKQEKSRKLFDFRLDIHEMVKMYLTDHKALDAYDYYVSNIIVEDKTFMGDIVMLEEGVNPKPRWWSNILYSTYKENHTGNFRHMNRAEMPDLQRFLKKKFKSFFE